MSYQRNLTQISTTANFVLGIRIFSLYGKSYLALSMHDSKKELWCVTCQYLYKGHYPLHASLWSLKLKS